MFFKDESDQEIVLSTRTHTLKLALTAQRQRDVDSNDFTRIMYNHECSEAILIISSFFKQKMHFVVCYPFISAFRV